MGAGSSIRNDKVVNTSKLEMKSNGWFQSSRISRDKGNPETNDMENVKNDSNSSKARNQNINHKRFFNNAIDIMRNEEAKDQLLFMIRLVKPGTLHRWQKILTEVNKPKQITITGQNTPISFDLSDDSLRETLTMIFHEGTALQSDHRIIWMKKYMPILFDKHSVGRGKRVSQQERNSRGLLDECYSYGEIDYECFATIFSKIRCIFGEHKHSVFCDLGSGVGNLVYTAALVGNFKKCIGIEFLRSLSIRAEKRLHRWHKIIENEDKLVNVEIEFICKDFMSDTDWISSSTFIVLHWTAFSGVNQRRIADILDRCKEGTIVVAFTHPIPKESFIILVEDTCETSWGIAEYFVQEKIERIE